MLSCPVCECHVRLSESTCPHCGAPMGRCSSGPSRLGVTLSAGLTMLACAKDDDPTDTNAGDSTTMISGDGDTTMDEDTSGDGDGDTTGDGDGDDWADEAAYGVPELSCEEFEPAPVTLGDNAISIVEGPGDIFQTCGSDSAVSLYAFTAGAAGDYQISLSAEFATVVSTIGWSCDPVDEYSCALPPEAITETLNANQTLYIAVDASETGGEGTLTITAL